MSKQKPRRMGRRMTVSLRRRYGSRLRRRITAHLRRTLIAGILILVPVAVTYVILRFVFDVVDGVLQPGIQWVADRWGWNWPVPGLGVVAVVGLVYLVGLFVANVLGRRIVGWVQAAILRVPLIGTVYSASRKLVESFSGAKQTGFKRVVMVQYPRQDSWTIGFLTAMTTALDGKRLAVVYIPTAPTPTSGWVAMVPIEEVYDTDLSVQAALQLVFSGGIVSPEVIKTSRLKDIDSTAELPSPKA